jgi:hypothetical protein
MVSLHERTSKSRLPDDKGTSGGGLTSVVRDMKHEFVGRFTSA